MRAIRRPTYEAALRAYAGRTMASLPARDLAALLELVRCMHDAPQATARHVLEAVRILIGSEFATFSDFDLHASTSVETLSPDPVLPAAAQQAFERHMHEHPLLAHYAKTGDGRAYKTSDFISQSGLQRLALYGEFIKPYFGTRYQIAIAVKAHPARIVGLSLARQRRDFSERDRLLLNTLRPHLAQAVRHAEAASALATNPCIGRGEDALRELVVTDARGRIRAATARADAWMRRYFGAPRLPGQLPDTISRWLEQQMRSRDRLVDAAGDRPCIAYDDHNRLVVQYVLRGDDVLLLLHEQRKLPLEQLTHLGLTRREAEILMWLAQGKSSTAIAAITGSASRTVEKHLEHIYRKLGVENRTAAAAIAHGLHIIAAGAP